MDVHLAWLQECLSDVLPPSAASSGSRACCKTSDKQHALGQWLQKLVCSRLHSLLPPARHALQEHVSSSKQQTGCVPPVASLTSSVMVALRNGCAKSSCCPWYCT